MSGFKAHEKVSSSSKDIEESSEQRDKSALSGICCCCLRGDEDDQIEQKSNEKKQSSEDRSIMLSVKQPNYDPPSSKEVDEKQSVEKSDSSLKSSSIPPDTLKHRTNSGSSETTKINSSNQGDAILKNKEESLHNELEDLSDDAVKRNTLLNSKRSFSGSDIAIGSEEEKKSDAKTKSKISSSDPIDIKEKLNIAGNEKKDQKLIREKKKGPFSFLRLFKTKPSRTDEKVTVVKSEDGDTEVQIAKDVLCLQKNKKGDKKSSETKSSETKSSETKSSKAKSSEAHGEKEKSEKADLSGDENPEPEAKTSRSFWSKC